VYLKGSHFGTQAIVTASPATTVALASRELVTASSRSAGQINLTSSTAYATGSTNLTFIYARSSDCVVGALLPADQTTAGCKFKHVAFSRYLIVVVFLPAFMHFLL
jgi:hypothetical protein